MASKPQSVSSQTGAAEGRETRPPKTRSGDIRSTRPYFLTRHPFASLLRRTGSILALLLLDVCGLALGLYLALTLREYYVGHGDPLWGLLWEAERRWLPFLTLVTVLVFWRAGLYAPREERAGFGRILSSLVIVGLVTLAFAIGAGHEFSTYGLVPTAVVLSAALIGLFRTSYERVSADVLRFAGAKRRTLFLGAPPDVAHLRHALGSSSAGIEYEFVGTVTPRGDAAETLAELPVLLARGSVDELIVADSELGDEQLLEIVEQAHREGVKVRVAPRATEILLAKRARYVPGQVVPLFELRPPVFAGTDWVVKRFFDVLVSAGLFVVGLPLWLVIALAVKLTSPGPVFYRDSRIGVGEREFSMLKFRTMHADAPERQPELEDLNEAGGALFKLRRDPRVTRVGALLRRFSLDEVPQILNVLRGQMSLVGPRPLPLRDYRRLEDWHRKRYLVLPGMTGLWQISGRSSLSFDDLVRLDFHYLENWSIWLDVSILLKTLPAVLSRRGAY